MAVPIKLFQNQDSFSLYLHVPFCKVKCTYCDFYSQKSSSGSEQFLQALRSEIEILRTLHPHLFTLPVYTIFIGGGTPSVLTIEEWHKVSELLHGFNLLQLKEWTIECNPESFTKEKAKAYLVSGVNRLSFGVQSLIDDELQLIGRAHNAERVHTVLSMPILKEFDAVSCDLIYGLPSQSLASLTTTIEKLTSYSIIKHISAYELTITEGTPLERMVSKLTLPTEEEMLDIIHLCRDSLEKAGFMRYEISNFAVPGFASLHNSAYWERRPYLGLGPAAHSFDGNYRFSNPASLEKYSQLIESGTLAHTEYESVDPESALEEYLFLRLRMNRGFEANEFKELFGEDFDSGPRGRVVKQMLEEQVLQLVNGRWCCTKRGLDIVDAVVLRLLDE